MAKPLTGLLAPGGYLVLSGILNGDQENSIRKIYTDHGLNFMKKLTKDEWAALQFQKN
jgi:ribosomal protein L11 methylase PrmA